MKEKIKFYLRNLLKYGTKLNENDTLIVVLSDMDKIVIECFREQILHSWKKLKIHKPKSLST